MLDEPALLHALQTGRAAGAYLDVFAKEPLPAQSPLWDMPNVIVTQSAAFEHEVDRIFLENLARWAAGEPLLNALTAG